MFFSIQRDVAHFLGSYFVGVVHSEREEMLIECHLQLEKFSAVFEEEAIPEHTHYST